MKPKNYLRTVWVLVLLDVVGSLASLLAGSVVALVWLIVHAGLGLWVGFILNWIARPQWQRWQLAVIAYWVFFVLSALGAGTFSSLQWLIAVVVTMKCTLVDRPSDIAAPEQPPKQLPHLPEKAADKPAGETAEVDWERRPKGSWPLAAAVFLLLAVVAAGLFMALADKSEFRGLGLFFTHVFFVTPFFLVAPALLRIPANAATKPYVIVLQYLIYVFLGLSWLLLLFVS